MAGEIKVHDNTNAKKRFEKAAKKLQKEAENLKNESAKTAETGRAAIVEIPKKVGTAVADSTIAANTADALQNAINPPKKSNKGFTFEKTTDSKSKEKATTVKPQAYKEEKSTKAPPSIVEVFTKSELPEPNATAVTYNPKTGLSVSARSFDLEHLEDLKNPEYQKYIKSVYKQQKNLYPETQVKTPLIRGGQSFNVTDIKDPEQKNNKSTVINLE